MHLGLHLHFRTQKIRRLIFTRQFYLFFILPISLQGAEVQLVSDNPNPATASVFNVHVIANTKKPVLGVDLRFEFDPQMVKLEELFAHRISAFHWHKIQQDSEKGYAVTGLMPPQENQTIDMSDDDTLAVARFSRLHSDQTFISIKSDYPIFIDSNLKPIDCVVHPLILETGSPVRDHENVVIVKSFKVYNYPNPFTPETNFIIETNIRQSAALFVYDITGRLVREEMFMATMGINRVKWHGDDQNGRPVPAGVYLYYLSLGHQFDRGKCVIIR